MFSHDMYGEDHIELDLEKYMKIGCFSAESVYKVSSSGPPCATNLTYASSGKKRFEQ
jgi:hypothetical protein